MNSDPSNSANSAAGSSADGATPARKASTINPITLFAALWNSLRWELLLMMADGRTLSATQAAAALRRDVDGVIKHFRVLRDAGVLSWKYSEQDARFLLYYIPQQWRPKPGVLDFGFCVLHVPTNRL